MCRLILAIGTFDSQDIVNAAVAMASGQTANHDSPLRNHRDGWGAIWSDSASSTGLSVMRNVRPAEETAINSGICAIRTGFLAIHVRNATYPTTRGLEYTHPLQRAVDGWYFMHNGSQPTVHQMLGLEHSTFDSAEYFDYLIPASAQKMDEQSTLDRLRRIPEGGNCGNAFAVSKDRAYVIHWQSPGSLWPRYFTMHQLIEPERRIIASEVVPSIAPASNWEPVPAGTLIELTLNNGSGSL